MSFRRRKMEKFNFTTESEAKKGYAIIPSYPAYVHDTIDR